MFFLKFRMGQRYRGPHQAAMMEQIQQSRNHIRDIFDQRYPNHRQWFHLTHRGTCYNFYINDIENRQLPQQIDWEVSVRIIRDELFDLETEHPNQGVIFAIPNGDTAARVQTFEVNLELENVPSAVCIHKHWLYYGHEHPQFSNVVVILE